MVGLCIKKDDDERVKQAWNFEMEGSRGRPKLRWKRLIEKECRKVGVNFEDANDCEMEKLHQVMEGESVTL